MSASKVKATETNETSSPSASEWVLRNFWDLLAAILPFILMVVFLSIGVYKVKCQ